MKKKSITFYFIILSLLLSSCSNGTPPEKHKQKNQQNNVAVVSVSDNGKYAITSNLNGNVYLWNLEAKTFKKVNKQPANYYSAGFINETEKYFYQTDKNNEVYIYNANDGKLIKTFNPKFASIGENINKNMTIYAGSENKELMHILDMKTGNGYVSGLPNLYFSGSGTVFLPKFTNDQKYIFATTGYGELWIWDAKTGKDIKNIIKNVGQTSNTISPNGKYVITTDSNMHGVRYDFATKKITSFGYDQPNKLDGKEKYTLAAMNSINFISNNEYITTYKGYNKLGFYNDKTGFYPLSWEGHTAQMKALGFFKVLKPSKVGNKTIYPNTSSYLPVVATSPSAHILVIGQANGGGIMVYKYNPDTKNLKLVWAPVLKQG